MAREPEISYLARFREADQKGQALWEHLCNVGDLAAAFAGKVGLAELGRLTGLLHDLGKGTREFDTYIRAAVGLMDEADGTFESKLDHSTAGAQYVYSSLKGAGSSPSIAAQMLALVIASHHSGLIDCINPEGHDCFSKRLEKDNSQTRVEQAVANLEPSIRAEVDGLLSLDLDEIIKVFFSSNQDPLDHSDELSFKLGLLTRLLFSCLIDADRTDSADFGEPEKRQLRQRGKYPAWSVLIARLEAKLASFEHRSPMDELRREISEKCREMARQERGLYRLTVPTGGGKTLASLRFGLYHACKHSMDRIIYVIPYTSIIDQNAHEIRRIMEVDEQDQGRIVLEHHSNLTPERETILHKTLVENWDAPIVLTTMVQFLEALFAGGTRSCRRMHQLVNSVIIFDEIQSLPVQCVHLFNVAIRFLVSNCKSTVMLCTATQPLLHQVLPQTRALPYDPQKVISPSSSHAFQAQKRITVHDLTNLDALSFAEAAQLVWEQLETSGSVLCVVNTKKAAYEIFTRLPDELGVEKYHLSTNMCPVHRLDVIMKIRRALKEKIPVICVSTQLIEAGVDVDFSVVIRSLAGLDSVAQAAGRCNRHGLRPHKGKLFLIRLKEENLDQLVEIKEGQKVALRVLEEFRANPERFKNNIIGSQALEKFFEYFFFQRRHLMEYPLAQNSPVGRNDTIFNLLAGNKISVEEYKNRQMKAPPFVLRQAFESAGRSFRVIDNVGQGVIVQYRERGVQLVRELCGAAVPEIRYSLLREAQRYSVNCSPYLLQELFRKGAVHEVQEGFGVYYLDERFYDEDCGLHRESAALMEVLTF